MSPFFLKDPVSTADVADDVDKRHRRTSPRSSCWATILDGIHVGAHALLQHVGPRSRCRQKPMTSSRAWLCVCWDAGEQLSVLDRCPLNGWYADDRPMLRRRGTAALTRSATVEAIDAAHGRAGFQPGRTGMRKSCARSR
jgi:hypothetical protein